METLERPVNDAIAEVEALCARRAFGQAVEVCEALLTGALPPRDEARVRVLAGQALARSSRPRPALEHLRRAREILAARPQQMLLAECADWEAGCLYLLEDSRALAVAEEALDLCRALDKPAPLLQARILEHLGSIHVRNHGFDIAIHCYEQTLEAAGAIRDLPRLARVYHGLGAAHDGRGETDRAVELVHKAVSLYSLEDDAALTARAENELGLLLIRLGQFDRAEELFLSALRHLESSGTEIGRSHVMLSLGEMYLAAGRLGMQSRSSATPCSGHIAWRSLSPKAQAISFSERHWSGSAVQWKPMWSSVSVWTFLVARTCPTAWLRCMLRMPLYSSVDQTLTERFIM